MTNLILAQGAEHIKQSRLQLIISQINDDKHCLNNITPDIINISNYINDKYINILPEYIAPFINQRYIVEEKYDGYSYINDKGKFFSKRLSQAKGNEGMPIEKTNHIPHISDILKNTFDLCGCDLHGELYIPGGISDDVTKILGCTEDKAQKRCIQTFETYGINKMIHYMLIDIRKFNGINITNEPYYIRRAILEYVYTTYIKPYDNNKYIQLAEILHGDPRDEFKRIVNSGGEGIIIKRTDAFYIPGKKPINNWIKGKKQITLDVIITGFNDGTGKNKSLFGSFEFGLYINNKIVPCGNCSSGLSDSIRQQIATDPDKYIGTIMEITAIQESINSFRNAVFVRLRDDKDIEECTILNCRINDNLI